MFFFISHRYTLVILLIVMLYDQLKGRVHRLTAVRHVVTDYSVQYHCQMWTTVYSVLIGSEIVIAATEEFCSPKHKQKKTLNTNK